MTIASRLGRASLCAISAVGVIVVGWSTASATALPAQRGQLPHAGSVDPKFGHRGKAIVPAPRKAAVFHSLVLGRMYGSGRQIAIATDGSIATLSDRVLLGFEANGRRDLSFGHNGRVQLRNPSGLEFQPTAIAFDSQGRLLVAGTTAQTSSQGTAGPGTSSGPPAAWATLQRYLPSGRLDTEFGNGGVVNTSFALPAPTTRPLVQSPTGVTYSPQAVSYQAASVVVTGLAVDSADRPVVTGAFANQVASCYAGTMPLSEGYVARLTASGDPDPSFGSGGIHRDPRSIQAEEPTIDRFERIVYLDRVSTLCGHGEGDDTALASLDANGQPDRTFGTDGYVALPFLEPPIFAVDRSGRIVLLERPYYGEDDSKRRQVLRLLASGARDASFGRDGTATVRLSKHAELSAIGTDRAGHVLLAGLWTSKPADPSRFLVKRMSPGGRLDLSWGRRGTAITGFGRKARSEAEQVLVDAQGRVIVGGTVVRPDFPTSGVGLARYLTNR